MSFVSPEQASLRKALEFFAGMVRPGAIHRREQEITVSEAASLGQPSVFSGACLFRTNTFVDMERRVW